MEILQILQLFVYITIKIIHLQINQSRHVMETEQRGHQHVTQLLHATWPPICKTIIGQFWWIGHNTSLKKWTWNKLDKLNAMLLLPHLNCRTNSLLAFQPLRFPSLKNWINGVRTLLLWADDMFTTRNQTLVVYTMYCYTRPDLLFWSLSRLHD